MMLHKPDRLFHARVTLSFERRFSLTSDHNTPRGSYLDYGVRELHDPRDKEASE